MSATTISQLTDEQLYELLGSLTEEMGKIENYMTDDLSDEAYQLADAKYDALDEMYWEAKGLLDERNGRIDEGRDGYWYHGMWMDY